MLLSPTIGNQVAPPSGWTLLYSMPWDILFLDFKRLDTVFENTARTDPAENGDVLKGVTDLSGAGNHGSQSNNTDDGTYGYDAVNGKTIRYDGLNHIDFSPNITNASGGTLMFLVDFLSSANYEHRWLRQGSGFSWIFRIMSTTVIDVGLSTDITVPAMSSGTLMVIATYEIDGGDTTVNLYVNDSSLSGTLTEESVEKPFDFNALGNTSGLSISSTASATYAFCVSSEILTPTQIETLQDNRELIAARTPVAFP